MSENNVESVTERVGTSRRAFVRRLMVGTAFAVPTVSSVNLRGAFNVASAQTNQTSH